MKTIAVLTDLSKTSEHATKFALHIAKKMKAQVLLFQVSEVSVSKQLVLAGEQDDFTDNKTLLADFGERIRHELIDRTFDSSYLPEVVTDDCSTDMVDIMTSIMGNADVCMVVTDPGTERDLATYMLSYECNRIIDWAGVPVLVVPETAPIRNFEKIAFASQLHEEDINSIAELGNLLESFSAELMVAHLNDDPSDSVIREKEQQLNNDLYTKLNCGGIYFRSIPDVRYEKNWDWLKANKPTDLLAVVQQPREQMSRFFKRGYNEMVTHHLTLPVLVLPKKP